MFSATKCEVQLAYAIGVAKPVSILVDTFGTCKTSEPDLIKLVQKHFDLRPAGIIKSLDLRRPIYKKLQRLDTLEELILIFHGRLQTRLKF